MRRLLAAVALLALTACDRGSETIALMPKEPSRDAAGFYCKMNLAEHPGPKGQIVLKGWKDPIWFSSVRDALTYVDTDIVSERELAGFWVNDMSRGAWEHPEPGSWVAAKDAIYVVASTRTAGMGGSEAVPFRERNDAEAFIRQFGGTITDYAGARRAMAEAPPAGTEERSGT